MNADVGIVVATIFGVIVIAFSTGIAVGHSWATKWWKDEMIRRRHAVYHWENGQWYWNEDEPKTPKDPAATKVRMLKNDSH